MLQAIGLTSTPRRDGPPVVGDLTFEARPGSVTALLGAPGSGKTTALRLMLELEAGRGSPTSEGVRCTASVTRPVRSGCCSETYRAIRHAPRVANSACSAPQPGFPLHEPTTCWRSSGSRGWGISASEPSRQGWTDGSGSPPRCSATPIRSFSTSRPKGSRRARGAGSTDCSVHTRRRAELSCTRPVIPRRRHARPTVWSPSTGAPRRGPGRRRLLPHPSATSGRRAYPARGQAGLRGEP